MTWVLGRFAGDLAEYRQAFAEAAGEYNESKGMEQGALLSPILFGDVSSEKRAAADSNLRLCRYFLLTVEGSWNAPPASFRHDYRLALACQADPELPLGEIVVLFRMPCDDEDGDERLVRFRAALETGIRQLDFCCVADYKAHVAALFAGWMAGCQPDPEGCR